MNNIEVYNQKGEVDKKISLSGGAFMLPWNDALVHQVIVSLEKNMRKGTAHTKQRAEVRGGGRKPWKQKGTGRARHGSIRSPIWVGGGVTFGPRKEKIYADSINKKMRDKAFFTVLSLKLRENKILFLNSLVFENPSTKEAAALLQKIGKMEKGCTIVFAEKNDMAQKSFQNIPGVSTHALEMLNTRDVLNARMLLFVNPEGTVNILESKAAKIKTMKEATQQEATQQEATQQEAKALNSTT